MDMLVRRRKSFRLAFRKFQSFVVPLGTVAAKLEKDISKGRCCYRGKFLSTRRSGSCMSAPVLENIRSGIILVLQGQERRVAEFFELKTRARELLATQSARIFSSGKLVLYFHL